MNWKAIKDFVLDDIWLIALLAIAVIYLVERLKTPRGKPFTHYEAWSDGIIRPVERVRGVRPCIVYDRELPFDQDHPLIQTETMQ